MRTFFAWAWVGGMLLLSGCARQEVRETVYPYEHPLASPGTEFAGLPPAVQQTVRAQAGGAPMHQITKDTYQGQTVYEVTFRDPEMYPPLYVLADGSVVYPNMTVAVGAGEDTFGAISGGPVTGVKFGDLPVNVANAIHEKAPTAEVAFINKVTVREKIFYEVSFKGNKHPKMFIAEDGTVLDRLPDQAN